MKIIILAGGGGTRLFPLSRTCFPKQFLKLDGEKSLFAQTVERFKGIVTGSDIIVVTNKDYFHHVQTELIANGMSDASVLLEPAGRNTAPAIAYAACYCREKLGAADGEVLFITPSDHIIKSSNNFGLTVRQAAALAENGRMVIFGIKPDKPETGYGYIQAGDQDGTAYPVISFKEKPDLETAGKYVVAGNYYWNSGMFCLTVGCLRGEFSLYQPEIGQAIEQGITAMTDTFMSLPEISIDYALAEKSQRVSMLPLTTYWNDIGSWDAIYDVLEKDTSGNAIKGDCLPIDCANTLIMGGSRLITGIGLENLLIVETDDVILVARRGQSQHVKDIVNELKKHGRREVHEHTTMYRPWGSYTILGQGPGYKMRKIVVSPGESLSMQLHYHRSEHWIVIGGTARVTIGEAVEMIHENQSVFVPQSTKHRLENPGRIPLELIEVQNGAYLEEDDIVRFEDVYNRV